MGKPRSLGARLNVNRIDADHLPPNTLWVEAQDIAQAYAELSEHVIHGDYTFGVWKMPDHGEFALAREFHKASAGQMPEWLFEYDGKPDFESRIGSPHSFPLSARLADMFGEQAANAARRIQISSATALKARENPSYLFHRLVSKAGFYADQGAERIHVDGMKLARFFTSWAGPGPLLYDSRQLEPLALKQGDRAYREFIPKSCYKPLDAWVVPEGCVTVLLRGGLDRPSQPAHSAPLPEISPTHYPRVFSTFDIRTGV